MQAELMSRGTRPAAVVFDLLFTLVHPGEFPGGGDRTTWLAGILGVDDRALEVRWDAFEAILESGRAPASAELGPELTWLTQVADELGKPLGPEALQLVERDWDLTRRRALLDPPAESVAVLLALRSMGLKIGVLSNTHGLEVREWKSSPLAHLVDAVAFSYEIGAVKPDPAAYGVIAQRLRITAREAAYVGDGSSNELDGARRVGFFPVVFAAAAANRLSPERVPVLRQQADFELSSLSELPSVLIGLGATNISENYRSGTRSSDFE
jgi:putative hydrolase of the HAD superfamily